MISIPIHSIQQHLTSSSSNPHHVTNYNFDHTCRSTTFTYDAMLLCWVAPTMTVPKFQIFYNKSVIISGLILVLISIWCSRKNNEILIIVENRQRLAGDNTSLLTTKRGFLIRSQSMWTQCVGLQAVRNRIGV